MDNEFEKDLLSEDENDQAEEIVNEQTEADEVESEENKDATVDTDADVAEDSDETEFDDDGEATDDEIPEPAKSSNRGVIVALIIVVVMIAAFFLIYFLQPKPKSVLNGVWESEASTNGGQVYFVFEDDKAYYMTNGNQVDYSVKYISEDEVELSYKNDTYSQVLGIKPEFSNDGKTVEFVNTYMNENYGYDENNKNIIIKLNKSDKTAKDLGVERNRETTTAAKTEATTAQATTVPSYKEKMSDKVKKSLQGIWVADSKSSDGKDSTKIFVTFDGEKLKYGNASSSLTGKAIYVDDSNVVFRFEDQDFYIAYGVKVSGDKLTLTPKYQIMSGYKQEATDNDTAVVLKKSDKEPVAETTKASDKK